MKKAGTTWWGQQWIAALVGVLAGDEGRLSRGRTYARAGRTHDLTVDGGKVRAKVTGSRPRPYEIQIELRRLDDAAWTRAIAGLAAKAEFAATLLGGAMPERIDDVFRAAGAGLFPASRAELSTSCSCPDWGDPCKHVAATHYVLGEALDRDPFLLFELRGRRKADVLEALRRARGGKEKSAKAAPEIPTVKLGKPKAADYDAAKGALPAMRFSFEEPSSHGALLRQLGTPAGWSDDQAPAETLGPLVRAAAALARKLALAEPTEPPPADVPRTRPRSPSSRARRPRGKS
jgi:uncharacterized Zn finger protein